MSTRTWILGTILAAASPAMATTTTIAAGSYDLTLSNASISETETVSVSMPNDTTRQFDISVEGFSSPLHVTLSLSARGALSGSTRVNAGSSWQWTGQTAGAGATGTCLISGTESSSSTWTFDLEPVGTADSGAAVGKKKVAKFKAGSELSVSGNK